MKLSSGTNPDIQPLFDRGVRFYDRRNFAEASAIFAQIMRMQPDHIPSIERLAAISKELGNLDMAINLFKAIVELAPGSALAYCNVAHTLQMANRGAEAKKYLDMAVNLDPRDDITMRMMGTLALEMGDVEKAAAYYLKAYELNPKNYGALSSYILYTRKIESREDKYFAALRKSAAEAEGDPDINRRLMFHQACAKAFHDLGDIDAEFSHIDTAARIKHAELKYNIGQDLKRLSAIKKVFTPALCEKLKPQALTSDAPIFIVGMPRSGSTLTDQILCSHGDVASIGEADILGPLVYRNLHIPGAALPFGVTRIKMNPVPLAQKYIEAAQGMAGSTKRFVDKTLSNYEFIGLIRATMPHAKIIHIRRNPMDCCLSCYSHVFGGTGHGYSYDLSDLGTMYRAYADLMTHWHEQFPGAILDVVYEELVENTENQVRRMLDYLNLPWDENCLAFYRTERQVRTASITQVRQPIYKSAIEKWRPYEKYLGPLIKALASTPAT